MNSKNLRLRLRGMDINERPKNKGSKVRKPCTKAQIVTKTENFMKKDKSDEG